MGYISHIFKELLSFIGFAFLLNLSSLYYYLYFFTFLTEFYYICHSFYRFIASTHCPYSYYTNNQYSIDKPSNQLTTTHKKDCLTGLHKTTTSHPFI